MSPPLALPDVEVLEPVRIRQVGPEEYLRLSKGPLAKDIRRVRFVPPGSGLNDFGRFEIEFNHYVLVPHG